LNPLLRSACAPGLRFASLGPSFWADGEEVGDGGGEDRGFRNAILKIVVKIATNAAIKATMI
jgi:hypothetical protein